MKTEIKEELLGIKEEPLDICYPVEMKNATKFDEPDENVAVKFKCSTGYLIAKSDK